MVDSERIFSLLDLTRLFEADDEKNIIALCERAVRGKAHVAAVCIYPEWVATAKRVLKNTPVNIATVANFPLGTDSLSQVLETIQQVKNAGADEVDIVFPYQQYLQGDALLPMDFISACKKACDGLTLKIILESGAIPTIAQLIEMSEMAIHAGADFLKTSTGKIPQGATLMAAEHILNVIKKESQYDVGFKVSGGVRTPQQACQYIELAEQLLGSDWVTPRHFRIGASQLVDELFL